MTTSDGTTDPHRDAALLVERLRATPADSPEAARRLVGLALAAVRLAPTGGPAPADRLADRPALGRALDDVGRFLEDGEWPDGPARWEAVLAAAEGFGPYAHDLTGTAAAAWAVFQLVDAVENMSEPDLLRTATGNAVLAADLAIRAGDNGYTAESVAFLRDLAGRTLTA